MSAVDKNQAVIDFLLACPAIRDNPLFFNFLEAQDDNKQIITQATDNALNEKYIDGTVKRRYMFTIIDFRSIAYSPVPKVPDITSQNVESLLDVQGILDWVTEQAELENYPDFGENCIIDEMVTTSDTPNLDGLDTSVSPVLAKYSISIQIDYIDTSKSIWNN